MSGSGWQPYWLPSHTYVIGAYVLPSTFTGWLWVCSQAGISDVTEPAWPAVPDPNQAPITDNTVVWTLTTGWRQALHAGLITTLTNYRTANPTIVHKVAHVRPSTFSGDIPLFYLGAMDEEDTLTQGTWKRLIEAEVFYVDVQPDPEQLDNRVNFVVDTIMDTLAAAFHAADPRSIMEPQVLVEPRDFDEKGALYAAVMFKVRGYITVGRT